MVDNFGSAPVNRFKWYQWGKFHLNQFFNIHAKFKNVQIIICEATELPSSEYRCTESKKNAQNPLFDPRAGNLQLFSRILFSQMKFPMGKRLNVTKIYIPQILYRITLRWSIFSLLVVDFKYCTSHWWLIHKIEMQKQR